MIVRSFLKWYDTAPAHERGEAVQMLAQAYLAGELGSDTPQEAEAALTLALDDPALSVRRALAWSLALSDTAPRHILVALAHDHADVAALILARSPQLRDADLIDCIRSGDRLGHLAIAMRGDLSPAVIAALTAGAEPEPLLALLENTAACLTPEDYRRIVARHDAVGRMREALIRRPDLPSDLRQKLVTVVSGALLGFMKATRWVDEGRATRLVSDACETATIDLAAESRDLDSYVEHLRASGQLTAALLLRSLLCGETALMGASLVNLADLAPRRVASMLAARNPGPFIAAYHKAQLPRPYLPAFVAALEAIREGGSDDFAPASSLKRPIIQRVLGACLGEDETEMRPVLAMLRRFDAEAARAEARALTERLKQAEQAVVLDAGEEQVLDLSAAMSPEVLDAEVEAALMAAVADGWQMARTRQAAPDLSAASETMLCLGAPEAEVEAAAPAEAAMPAPVMAEPAELTAEGRLSDDLEALFAKAFAREDDHAAALVISETMEPEAAPAGDDPFAGWDLRRTAA